MRKCKRCGERYWFRHREQDCMAEICDRIMRKGIPIEPTIREKIQTIVNEEFKERENQN